MRRRPLTVRTTAGPVTIEVPYVQLRDGGDWISPVRRAWDMNEQQPVTPELEERLCLTATATFSFGKAAQVAACWGSPVADDSTIWQCVQRAGERAMQAQAGRDRQAQLPAEREQMATPRDDEQDFDLVIMLDGWMARERGEQWGLKPKDLQGDRVQWREQKTAIIFRTDHRGATQSERAVVTDKAVLCIQGEWDELAKQVHAEALRRGAARAREVFIVADGGIWIWKLVAERFPHATQTLDFYHASQHLWAIANTLHGQETEQARQWIEPLLHQLRHSGEAGALDTIRQLATLMEDLDEDARELIRKGQNYFTEHQHRLHYAEVESRGCPIGSGAMESTCSQLQGRFKRTGQFWKTPGKARLMALLIAEQNGFWQELWPITREQR